jgi:hypothetical protein
MERAFLTYPRVPVPASGHTVPLPIKSTTVYVTLSENTLYLRVVWAVYLAFFIGVIGIMSHKKWPIR